MNTTLLQYLGNSSFYYQANSKDTKRLIFVYIHRESINKYIHELNACLTR